jgi:hypothetical protein
MFMDFVSCRLGRFYLPAPHPRYALPFFYESGDLTEFYRQELRKMERSSSRRVWLAGATDTDLCRASLAGMRWILDAEGFRAMETFEFPNSVLILLESTESTRRRR